MPQKYPIKSKCDLFEPIHWKQFLNTSNYISPNEFFLRYIYGTMDLSDIKSECGNNYLNYEKNASKIIISTLESISLKNAVNLFSKYPPENFTVEEVSTAYNLSEAVFVELEYLRYKAYTNKEISIKLPACSISPELNDGSRGNRQSKLLALLDLARVNDDGKETIITISPLGREFVKLPLYRRLEVLRKLILRMPLIRNVLRSGDYSLDQIRKELSKVFSPITVDRWDKHNMELLRELVGEERGL